MLKGLGLIGICKLIYFIHSFKKYIIINSRESEPNTFSISQGSNGSGMAWRDYSVSGTNYGYDAYDEKMGPNAMQLQQTTGHYPPANGHGHGNGGAPYPSTNGNGSYAPPSMSLPRPHHGAGPPNTQSMMRQSAVGNGGGGVVAAGGSNGLNHNPDFYFMPSQRKYSGEMVRVYVDHNKR